MLVVATRLEEAAVRLAAPALRVVRVGIALRRPPRSPMPLAISCGLSGGLTADMQPGTVAIAVSVADEEGSVAGCDEQWTDLLLRAARSLGLPVSSGPLVSTRELATGNRRAQLAARGFTAADQESALLASHVERLAVCRVVLDTPAHELDPRWTRPAAVLADPRRWGEATWLGRHAPAYAARSGRVAAAAWRILNRGSAPGAR